MWQESIYASSLICLIIDILYISPYFVSMPSKFANAIISGGIGLICIAWFLSILPDYVWLNSYIPLFSLWTISHGSVNKNSVFKTMCFALFNLTALLANTISPISNTRGYWRISLIRSRWYALVYAMQRDAISRLLNRSLACLEVNVSTHCFELVRLTAVSCEKSIGKENLVHIISCFVWCLSKIPEMSSMNRWAIR